jgi:hypothetical protein
VAIIPLRGFGDGGVTTDVPPQDVPANGVTRAENVTFRDGAVAKASGYSLLFTNGESFPRNFTYWLQPWRYSGAVRMAMFKSAAVQVWDGNTVTTAGLRDQSNSVMTLTSSTTWQSDRFGAFVVASNNVDAPIFSWNIDTSLADGSRFTTIPGWGAANSPGGAVRAIRSFKNFLFGIGVASDPYAIYWSDAAPVDSFPQSWDYASTSTLAFDGRRGAFFEQQLVAALRILQRGDTTPPRMVGSWAGAMGQTQFMPSSFMKYAVDGDGDRRLGRGGGRAGAPGRVKEERERERTGHASRERLFDCFL